MGILNFIKKIFENNKDKEIEKEKIGFSEIGDWIDKKKKEIEVREEKVFVLIQEKINVFVNELKEKVRLVEDVNLKLKKAEDRMESVSEEGRKKYLESVELFIEDLDELEKENLEKFSKKIDKIFLDFNKRSHMSYERATILIGKEMAEVKETLKSFSKDLIKIFEKNKDIINSLKTFSLIELNLNEIVKIDQELEEIKKAIAYLDKGLLDKEEENKKILNEIEEIKKSEIYLENLSRQDKIKLLKEELEKELLSLKQIIDFKALANFYHIFEDRMELVKEYRDDFQKKFKRDNGENTLDLLLNESKLNNLDISNKMNKIKDKKKDIMENEQEIKPDKIQELYTQTTKIILDIGNLKNEKIRKEKRGGTLKILKEELLEKVKEKVEGAGGGFV